MNQPKYGNFIDKRAVCWHCVMSTTSESLDLVDKEESVEKRSLECTCSISINGSCNRDEAPEDAETSRSDHDEFQDTLSQRRRLPLCGDERIWAPVLSVMVVASLPALLFGCTLGFPSPVLLDLMESDKQEFRFDTLLSDLFSAIGLVGGMIGGLPAGWVADKWGRKVSVAVSGIVFAAGYAIIAFARVPTLNPQTFKSLLMVGRFVTGIASGWTFVSIPVYSAEISSTKLRGILTSFAELSLAGGILLVYILGSIDGFTYFEISIALLGIVILFLVMVPWIPETPRWLIFKRKDRQKAMKVLKCLRGSGYSGLHDELEGIEAAVESSGSLSVIQLLKEFKKKNILVPFLILLVLMILQELCGGGTTVNTYAAPVFKEAGVKNPLLSSSYAIGGSQLFATIISVCIIDCVGRKLLLLLSFSGMFVASIMLGVHFYITRPSLCDDAMNSTSNMLDDSAISCNNQFAPLAIVSLIFFIMSFAVGLGPVLWTLMSEYLPLHVRGFASGVVIVANWAAAASVTGLYLSYANLVKPWFAWWTFSIINLGGLVFVLLFVVETKGKSLEKIQEAMMHRFRFCSRRTANKYYVVCDIKNGND